MVHVMWGCETTMLIHVGSPLFWFFWSKLIKDPFDIFDSMPRSSWCRSARRRRPGGTAPRGHRDGAAPRCAPWAPRAPTASPMSPGPRPDTKAITAITAITQRHGTVLAQGSWRFLNVSMSFRFLFHPVSSCFIQSSARLVQTCPSWSPDTPGWKSNGN